MLRFFCEFALLKQLSQYIPIMNATEAHEFIHEMFTSLACTLCFLPLAWNNPINTVPEPVGYLSNLSLLQCDANEDVVDVDRECCERRNWSSCVISVSSAGFPSKS